MTAMNALCYHLAQLIMRPIYTISESHGLIGEYLALFAATEVFIYIFMEIITKIETIQRVLFHKARWTDFIIFVLVFGGFSIFGTYVGIPLYSGAISNIRDLAPMVAGLTAGPVVGLAVGLIGGIHRFCMGGFTCFSCSLSTILAGLIAGFIYSINKKKLVKLFPAIGVAILIELIHGGLTLLIARPFDEALRVVMVAIPEMLIANAIGMALSIIIIHNTREIRELKDQHDQSNSQV
jgi:sigma-B regulation protein RsbU (phosphoserine phosphatase)